MRMLFAAAALSMASLAGALHAQESGGSMAGSGVPLKSIAKSVAESPVHKTLATALQAAGLTETLGGPGPYTLLAPPDAVFASLPAGFVDEMLKAENKDALAKVLLCHVIDGALVSGDLKEMQAAGTAGPDGVAVDTLGGCKLTIRPTETGGVTVTDENGTKANVVTADLAQANGVIHVIDAIMKPKGM